MNSQNNANYIGSNLRLLHLASFYSPLSELGKSTLTQGFSQHTGASRSSQSFIPYKHQEPLQVKPNLFNAEPSLCRPLPTTLIRPQPLRFCQSVDREMLCDKGELNDQESKPSTKNESPEHEDRDSLINIAIHMKKEGPTKDKPKKEISLDQERNNARKKKSYWLPSEDEMLSNLIQIHGEKWTKIASYLDGRTGKQARDRYVNYLKPSIKQKAWTTEEEGLLEQLYQEFGNKWSKIANSLPGRTENQVKNKFYSGVRTGKYLFREASSAQEKPRSPLDPTKLEFHLKSEASINIKAEGIQNCNTQSDMEDQKAKESLENSEQNDIQSNQGGTGETGEISEEPYKKVKLETKNESPQDASAMNMKQEIP